MFKPIKSFVIRDSNNIPNVLMFSTLTVHTLHLLFNEQTEYLNGKRKTAALMFQNKQRKSAVYSEWDILQRPDALLIILNTGRIFISTIRGVFTLLTHEVFQPLRDAPGVYIITAKTPTWWDLQSDWMSGRDHWQTRGVVIKLAVRPLSLCVAKCLFYYHITFSSL